VWEEAGEEGDYFARVICTLYARGIDVAEDLIAELSCRHVRLSAFLARSIFEGLVNICFVIADEKRQREHIVRLYRLDHEERASYLEKVLQRRDSIFAPIIVKGLRQTAEKDPDGFNRIHWNECYQDGNYAGFLAKHGLERFTAGLDSRLLMPEETAQSLRKAKPWSIKHRIKDKCEVIDNPRQSSRKGHLFLAQSSYCEEYDLVYAGFCQLVHPRPPGGRVFSERRDGVFFIRTPPPDESVLDPLAWKGLEYFSQIIKVVYKSMDTTPGDAIEKVFEGVENLRQRLSQLLHY
jgi:hypothetical protein